MTIQEFIISKDPSIYEAFPRLILTKTGDLICFFTECISHSDRSFSRIVYTRSSDRGRNWSDKQVLSESGDEDNFEYDCVGATVLEDGRIIVVINRVGKNGNENIIIFGDREGKVWNEPKETPITGIVPDNPCELSTGRLLIATHERNKSHGYLEQNVWYSDDQGNSWEGPMIVSSKEGLHFCEASIVSLPCETLVAYMRENSGKGLDGYKAISTDYGLTWEGPYQVPLPGCHRPVAGLLKNNYLLITHRFMQGGKGWLGYWTQNLFAALTDIESAKALKRNQQWSRILPIDFDRSLKSDTGYSDWIQFSNEEIYIVNYIVDDMEKAYIKGYVINEESFLINHDQKGI